MNGYSKQYLRRRNWVFWKRWRRRAFITRSSCYEIGVFWVCVLTEWMFYCWLLYLERLRRTFMIRWWKSDRNSSCNVLQWSSVRRSAHLSCVSVRLCHQMSVFTRIVTKILVSVWTRPEAALHIKIKVMWRWSVFLFSLTSNRKSSFVADWKRILSELTLTSSAWKMALR